MIREPLATNAMELEIRNADLIPSAVPDTAADFDRLEAFALSFDGYAHWGDRCGAHAETAAAAFHSRRSLPDDLSDLRACLFYESQRWRWQPDAAGDASRAYVQALLDAIRSRISTRGSTGFASRRAGRGPGSAGASPSGTAPSGTS